jgi:hypothetical protein
VLAAVVPPDDDVAAVVPPVALPEVDVAAVVPPVALVAATAVLGDVTPPLGGAEVVELAELLAPATDAAAIVVLPPVELDPPLGLSPLDKSPDVPPDSTRVCEVPPLPIAGLVVLDSPDASGSSNTQSPLSHESG